MKTGDIYSVYELDFIQNPQVYYIVEKIVNNEFVQLKDLQGSVFKTLIPKRHMSNAPICSELYKRIEETFKLSDLNIEIKEYPKIVNMECNAVFHNKLMIKKIGSINDVKGCLIKLKICSKKEFFDMLIAFTKRK